MCVSTINNSFGSVWLWNFNFGGSKSWLDFCQKSRRNYFVNARLTKTRQYFGHMFFFLETTDSLLI